MIFVRGVDIGPLFPRGPTSSAEWVAQGREWVDVAHGVAVRVGGELVRTSASVPPSLRRCQFRGCDRDGTGNCGHRVSSLGDGTRCAASAIGGRARRRRGNGGRVTSLPPITSRPVRSSSTDAPGARRDRASSGVVVVVRGRGPAPPTRRCTRGHGGWSWSTAAAGRSENDADRVEGCERRRAPHRSFSPRVHLPSTPRKRRCASRERPLFNAGTGACLTEEGLIELRRGHHGVRRCAPERFACCLRSATRLTLPAPCSDEGRHVLYAGTGAAAFARRAGFEPSTLEAMTTIARARNGSTFARERWIRVRFRPGPSAPGRSRCE